MNTSESLEALRRANPRKNDDLVHAVAAARDLVDARFDGGGRSKRASRTRPTLVRGLLVGAALVALGAAAALFAAGSPGGEDATAAVTKAARLTASSAERSGTAVVRITNNGELWAAKTIRWQGGDLSVSDEIPTRRGRPGSQLLLVDGMLYGIEEGEWIALGSPESIDPGSGTTPDEYLAATREDVGGVTLRRITSGLTGLTRSGLADGSAVYRGTVVAGAIARESGFKEGRPIRLLPFGYVAHDEAANPAAPLGATVTVGADGVVREIAVTWGTWTYTVTYSRLATTAAMVAPANPRPLRERLRRGR
jgi:hypothetical protein